MADRLIEVFAEGLQVDPSTLGEDTSPDTNDKWDSLAAMELVMGIEETFEVKLSTREIMKMRSIGAAREVLKSKGVEGL